MPFRQRLEGDRRMRDVVAHRDNLALAEQQIIDRFLDFEDVDVHLDIRIAVKQRGNGLRHHDVGDTGNRPDRQLDTQTTLKPPDRILEVVDLAMNFLQLRKNITSLVGGNVTSGFLDEELDAERSFDVLHRPADAGLGNVHQASGAGDRAGNHDCPHDLDLAQGQHRLRAVPRLAPIPRPDCPARSVVHDPSRYAAGAVGRNALHDPDCALRVA